MKVAPEDFVTLLVPAVFVVLVGACLFGVYLVIANFPQVIALVANHPK